MPEIDLSTEALQHIQVAEQAINKWTIQALRQEEKVPDRPVRTEVHIVDCVLEPQRVVLVVEKGHLGLALGREAINQKRLKELFQKDVKVIEFDQDKAAFVSNVFKPFKPEKVEVEQKRGGGPLVATVTIKDEEKGKAIGKGGKNVNLVRLLAKRHHQIDEVKVL